MKTTVWDRVVTSAPINKDAAVARDGKGEGFEPKLKDAADRVHSDTPLPTRKPLKGSPDYSGQRSGRLVVVGLSAEIKQGDRPAAWVVRCACGNYEHRTAKSINNPRNVDDCCRPCRQVEYLKRRAAHGTRLKAPADTEGT